MRSLQSDEQFQDLTPEGRVEDALNEDHPVLTAFPAAVVTSPKKAN